MDDLAKRYQDRTVRSIFIYTREAHPGERVRHHKTLQDKRERARLFQGEFNVERQIFLDDLDGTAHSVYGMLPNMTWILGKGGLVEYRAGWTIPSDIELAINHSLEAQSLRAQRSMMLPCYTERRLWQVKDEELFREGLERNGPQAVSDFFNDRLEEYKRKQIDS